MENVYYALYVLIAITVVLSLIYYFKIRSNHVFRSINLDEFKENYKNGQLVDVRTKREYKSGKIPQSLNIPLHRLSDNLDKLKKEEPVYLYCATGSRSRRAGAILSKQGFSEVYDLRGGVAVWPYKLRK